MRTKKADTFPWRSKNVRKRTKADEKGILCKSTLTGSVCSNCARITHETNTLLKTNCIVTNYLTPKNYWFSLKNTNVWENAHRSTPLALGEEPLYLMKKRRLTPARGVKFQ